MKFHSVDELDHFSFRDAQVFLFEERDQRVLLEVEALIVKGNNSQNSRFYDSYADTTQINLVNGRVIRAVKEGFRYYDADGVLQKEVPDEPLTKEQTDRLLAECKGAFLFAMEKKEESGEETVYSIGLEFGDDSDGTLTMGESFWIDVACTAAEADWEHYLNRVDR